MKQNKVSLTQYAMKTQDIEAYIGIGGYHGLKTALDMDKINVVKEVQDSKLRGRGGAGFPTGKKWAGVPPSEETHLVCNADEGEPGTFKDRYIMENTPFLLLEGMTIAGYAAGAAKGYIYIRGEYPKIADTLKKALEAARSQNMLGNNILGSAFSFDIEMKRGGGSYVVGDETALLNSLMGKRGFPWMKPPYPTKKGLWNQPTVVNNVETLSYVPLILAHGAAAFSKIGVEGSTGPKLYSVSGHVNSPGVYEFPMGVSVKDLLKAAGGVKGQLKAVQIGGTAGPIYAAGALAMQLDYDAMQAAGGTLGSGAVVVMNSKTNMAGVLDVSMRFFAEESCGQCFPCRYGTRQLNYMARRIAAGTGRQSYLPLMQDTGEVMRATSFCPFGQSVSTPLNSLLQHFGDEVKGFIQQQDYVKEVI
ncbi:NADH-ubiquinone oxidoreductase-F iron-sulfur binding region domain-containing protein [Marispirochaeta sp.]|uniref:complex I 51 kDa subunit family protein n=1 Tax=Marispirochaeta sp. TaxID=2038653 RepID=UPI0029C8029C|nr:NADH-ubiquinone oxidoreductase-F iron-sulfur binding region domain-containing protein [Marispirochaeta sp.]